MVDHQSFNSSKSEQVAVSLRRTHAILHPVEKGIPTGPLPAMRFSIHKTSLTFAKGRRGAETDIDELTTGGLMAMDCKDVLAAMQHG